MLGDFIFQDFEVPEHIDFGGDQQLSVKKALGGVRTIDALGPDPSPITWSGTFFPTVFGGSALDRALTLAQMRDAGQPLVLSWDELYLMVYIRQFKPDYRFARIPYQITLEVLADLTAPVFADALPGIDDLISGDLNAAMTLTAAVNDGTFTGLMGAVSVSIGAIPTFVGATSGVIASVLMPLNAATQRLAFLIASNDAVFAGAVAPGAVMPGMGLQANLGAFNAQLNASVMQSQLLSLKGLLGRMTLNLSNVNSSQRVITVGGGSLFDIASREYGDATAWTQIANANGLTDPVLSGTTTLIIPPYSASQTGGILGS